MITLITPTGSRHEAFALCELWMRNQIDVDTSNIQWIVVDDNWNEPTKCTMDQTYIRGPKHWNPNINTQRYNMDVALEYVKGDFIFVIEDDDYYHPRYLTTMMSFLQQAPIVGLSNSKYYNLKIGGYKYMNNYRHASLCHTALRKEVLPYLSYAIHSGDKFFDVVLWEKIHTQRIASVMLANSHAAIGIKGMPGKAGIGIGHEEVGYNGDKNNQVLKEWVGRDFPFYEKFLNK